jgi:hypothetical protein
VVLSVLGWRKQPDPTGTSPVTTSARTYTTLRDSILTGADLQTDAMTHLGLARVLSGLRDVVWRLTQGDEVFVSNDRAT